MSRIICVYKITSPTGKIYVGSSVNYRARIASYKNLSCKYQPKLYQSLLKHGVNSHTFEIIEYCTLDNVRQREAYHGHNNNVLSREFGMNHALPKSNESYRCRSEDLRARVGLMKKGNKNTLGRKATLEQKAYLSDIRKGKSRGSHSQATKLKMSNSAIGGKNHKSKILLNLNTGIFYECFQDAAKSVPMNYNTFRSNLYKNKPSPFIVTQG